MTAVFSLCETYRYRLDRGALELAYVMWCLCNPSKADAEIDDQTVRKGRGFSKLWGYDHFAFGNVAAYCATDPDDLLAFKGDRVGPDNEHHLREMAAGAEFIVVAWGDALPKEMRNIAKKTVRDILIPSGKPIKCLGYTKGHQPKHPLTLGYSTPLMEYRL